jgi:hypothetical protein
MADARERLTRLIELATENAPDKQQALAFELCDLLVNWPQRYPRAMREPFEALLEKVRRRIDMHTRQMIALRLNGHTDTTLALLNDFYLDLPQDLRAPILARNAERGADAPAGEITGRDVMLIAAARKANGHDLVQAFAQLMGLSEATAQTVFDDVSGDALAVVCKGSGISRTTYSTLAVLAAKDMPAEQLYERLAAFDAIPELGARRVLAHWRREQSASGARAA